MEKFFKCDLTVVIVGERYWATKISSGLSWFAIWYLSLLVFLIEIFNLYEIQEK